MISLLLVLLIVGVILFFINRMPIDPLIQQIIYAVILICTLLYVLQFFGLVGHANFLR